MPKFHNDKYLHLKGLKFGVGEIVVDQPPEQSYWEDLIEELTHIQPQKVAHDQRLVLNCVGFMLVTNPPIFGKNEA